MKKLIALLLIVPVIGMSQVKTVLSSNRIFPKADKGLEFEKALASHAQKYHTGDVTWRVWSIESGPDAGGYMVTEGPSTWEGLDSRGDISAEHTSDWANNVWPLSTGVGQSGFYDFKAAMSTVKLTDYADKIMITHMTSKPGKTKAIKELIDKMKKVWEASKESVAVYMAVASGDPGYILVNRMTNGLKELSADFRKPIEERFNAVYGSGAFDKWLKDYSDIVLSRYSEILVYKPLLSSK